MYQFFLQANYRVLPDFSEIKVHEERLLDVPKNDGLIRSFPNEYHHEIFESKGIILFKDGKWEKCSSGDFETVFDSNEEYPVAFIDSTTVLGLGVWSKIKGGRSEINWNRWLQQEDDYMEWDEMLLDAAKHFSKDLTREYYLSCLYELYWHPSVDWETGIDEGNFEISRTIFNIPPTNGDILPTTIHEDKKSSFNDLLTFDY